MSKYKKIESVEQLKEALKGTEENGPLDFCIALCGGAARSSKSIMMYKKGKKLVFDIINEIDDTQQILTEKQLFDDKITHIGTAIKNGGFYQYL